MPTPQELLARLEAVGRSVAATGHGLALLGLGSVGTEVARLDHYSDLDFFVIVQPGRKQRFLESLDWLETVTTVVYSFLNTVDGYKLLFADGIFAEMAIFEPQELVNIPFAGGRIIWQAAGFTLPVPPAGNRRPQGQEAPSTEWRLNEALSNLYVGLGRFQRGEKLSAARFIQGYAVDQVLALAPQIERPHTDQPDPFDRARRFEQHFPETAAFLPRFLPGYEDSPAAARSILAFLDSHFDLHPMMKAAVLERCQGQTAENRR